MAETVQESEAESRRRIFEELPVPQALKVMVVPTIISQIIVLIYNMADTFYVGRTNDPYMVAGVSLILPVFNILICLAGLAGTGGGTLISRLLGEGKETEARRVSWFSIYISIGMALFYSVIMGLFMDPILKALGASDTIFSYARQYVFCVIVLGAVPTVLSNVLSNLVRSTGMSREASVGIPASISSLLFDLDYVIIDKLMVAYSEVSLAAIGIVLKVERLPLNVGVGICQGMMPLVAYNYASKNHTRMNSVIKNARNLGLAVAAVSIVLYEVLAPMIVEFFISDGATVALATDFLRARVLATPLMFMSFFTVYLFQSFGLGNKSLFLAVMRWGVFNIPMLFLLDTVFGMYGIVWSQVAADTLTVLLSLYVYESYKKKHLKILK